MKNSNSKNLIKNNDIIEKFDWKEYLIANTDLIDGGINTEKLAKRHWNTIGQHESRKLYTNEFDWTQYVSINQDLIESGCTTKQLVQEHYIRTGYNEGRLTILKDFDWEFYIIYNNHLMHTGINTQSRAVKHWLHYGSKENLLTHIKPLKNIYDKIISFDYANIYDIYDNVNNIILYGNHILNNSILQEQNLHYINKRNNPIFKNLSIISDINILKKNKDIILIVDFPCYGGGCSFFINTIISHYKYNTTFLIVRNFKNKIYWYINDEQVFKTPMNEEQSIKFINSLKSNVSKIFFNSIVEHTHGFIEALFDLHIETTIITHDYSLFFDKSQLYYYEIDTMLNHNKLNIHKFNRVITQHIGNLHTFGKNMNNYSNIVVSELPDFRTSTQKIISKNTTFVIGIIGDISDVKGYYVLNEISKKIANHNIEIVVFGKVHSKSIIKQFSYHNINDLNNLLETYKPNVLLELSLWPESYSYTLSLGMITQLPILYQNKFFPCTIQRRLSLYNNAHSFDDIDQVSIDWILNKGQSYLYLIKPTVYFPPFWDYYFTTNQHHIPFKILNQEYNVVMITSKIYTSKKPFSYIAERSIYTPRQRLDQTIETINSIRKYIPNSFIVLYDNSVLDNDEFQTINNLTDCFINHHNDSIINNFTDNSIHKLYGEIAQTYKILHYMRKYHTNMNVKNLFKITGRYTLNETFDFNKLDNDDIIFKRNSDIVDRLYYFTCFYKIGMQNLQLFYDTINELFDDISEGAYEFEEWEVLLPTLLYGKFTTVDQLGVTQNIGVWNDQSKI